MSGAARTYREAEYADWVTAVVRTMLIDEGCRRAQQVMPDVEVLVADDWSSHCCRVCIYAWLPGQERQKALDAFPGERLRMDEAAATLRPMVERLARRLWPDPVKVGGFEVVDVEAREVREVPALGLLEGGVR